MISRIIENKKKIIGLGGVIGGIIGFTTCYDTIPPNHVGYSNLFGDVGNTKLSSGFHIKSPLVEFIKIPLLTSNLSVEIDIATKEGLILSVQINTIYRIDENNSRDIYLKYKTNYENIFIKPLIESGLRNIISSYEAKDLYNEKTRIEIKKKMDIEITNMLKPNGFIVEDIMINKIKLPLQLQMSIENKLKSEQENEQMTFIIEREKKQLVFNIEKEKMEAERKTIEANGIKAFQDIVSRGISKELIAWKGIEATEKIAKSSNSKIIIIGNKDSGGLPIIFPTEK